MASALGGRLSSFGGNGSDTLTKVRRVLIVVAILVVALFLLPSTVTYVNPGYVGIVIHRAGGGVDKTPLGPGLHFRNPLTTGIEEYPVFLRGLFPRKGGCEGRRPTYGIKATTRERTPSPSALWRSS